MKFSPTEPELVKATEISVLSDDASNLREPNLYIWGSKWDEKHLQALRVLIFNDLSVSRLLPQRWLPHHNLKVYQELREAIQEPPLEYRST